MLSSANSINWGRLLPQIVYYISAYCDLLKNDPQLDSFNVVVPTGNFGDIMAGWYALKMGLPVRRLICASNKNDVLTEFLNTGHYDRKREFRKTTSPSMDILISSNLERLLYHLSDDGICASSGSACSSGSLDVSHVLRAMGVPYAAAHGSIRFSLSRYTTEAEVDYTLEKMPAIVQTLRELSPFVEK